MRYGTLVLIFVLLCVSCARREPLAAPQIGHPASSVSNAGAYPEITALDTSGLRRANVADGSSGSIGLALSAPAVVRLRIVDKRTPGIILRTLLDWEPLGGGRHEIPWDGKDLHGEPVDPHLVSIAALAEPQRELLDDVSRPALAQVRHPQHKHFLHPKEDCGDLTVRIASPRGGIPVSGVVVIEAVIEGRLGMPDGEYHVVVYLDGRVAWDGRVKEPRLAEQFDTRNLPNGDYTLAVSFSDLRDHSGSDWTRITIENN